VHRNLVSERRSAYLYLLTDVQRSAQSLGDWYLSLVRQGRPPIAVDRTHGVFPVHYKHWLQLFNVSFQLEDWRDALYHSTQRHACILWTNIAVLQLTRFT
jgi:hypothetical protein